MQASINNGINRNEAIWREMVHQAQHFTRPIAVANLLKWLHENGITHNPDGIKYNKTNLRNAMKGW